MNVVHWHSRWRLARLLFRMRKAGLNLPQCIEVVGRYRERGLLVALFEEFDA